MKFQFPARTLALAFGIALMAASTSQAETYFLRLKGQKSGEIKGSVTQKGRENSIQVLNISHQIVSPRDIQSGLPTGQRQHKPFTITVPLDRSAPLLYNALCTNENIMEFTLNAWTPQIKAGTGVGAEIQFYTVRLTNANIASIEEVTQTDANGANPKQVLKVAFTYQKIEWTWTDGGITALDDWEARI